MSLPFGSLLKKATDFLGLSSPSQARPPPLDGEIIYCKNNVCVHPPAALSAQVEHYPGYLNVRSQDDEVLGSTLILTWIPNSSLQKNPRSIENSPARVGKISPRRSPRQEYAKPENASPGHRTPSEGWASPASGTSAVDTPSALEPRKILPEEVSECAQSCHHCTNQRSDVSSKNLKNNKKEVQDCPRVPGVGTNVNEIQCKNTNAEKQNFEKQDDESVGDSSSKASSPSSSSASPTTERQLFMLLHRARLKEKMKERSSSSKSVTSIEMEGDNLVVVTEEIEDSPFLDEPINGDTTWAKSESPETSVTSASLSSDSTQSSPTGQHYERMMQEMTENMKDILQTHDETDKFNLNRGDGIVVKTHSRESNMSNVNSSDQDAKPKEVKDLNTSNLNVNDQGTDILETHEHLQVGGEDKMSKSDNCLSINSGTPAAHQRSSSVDLAKLKGSLDLKLTPSVSMPYNMVRTPEIAITPGSPPDSPPGGMSSGSSSTSGPDSNPPSPLSMSPSSNLGSPISEHIKDPSMDSLYEASNLQFPNNSISYNNSPSSTPGSTRRTAKEQVCGVFSVDLGQMRSLRIFYHNDKCTSGQLVIASRESQYKILHFHHGGLDRLSDVLDDWKFLAQPKGKRGKEQDNRSRQYSVIRPYLPNEGNHPEEGAFEMLTQETWIQHMNEQGQIQDEFLLRKVIFFAGVQGVVRQELWPFLLHYYPCSSTFEERDAIRNDKYIEYQDIRKRRENMTAEEKEVFWRNIQCTVEKDVVRTDRSHPYFKGEDNPNIEILKHILLNYAVEHPHYGYTQGMSDLLAPVLAEVQNEVDAYWCFVGLMQKTIFVSSPKDVDMDQQLLFLKELIRLMLPRFYAHLEKVQDGMELLFCHRWILLCFKREFPEIDALRIWEACWAHYQTDYFHLFVCVAIMAVYGEDVVEQDLPADEMLLHFSSLSMHMSGQVVLKKARSLLHKFRTLQEIPCTLAGLCSLCGSGMWDSGHVPLVTCTHRANPDGCPYGVDSKPLWPNL